jgi:small-conductance mechanosensitive channel
LQVRQAQEALQTQLAELQGRLTVQQQAWQKRQKILEAELAAQRSLVQQAQAQSNKAQEQLSQWLAQHKTPWMLHSCRPKTCTCPACFWVTPVRKLCVNSCKTWRVRRMNASHLLESIFLHFRIDGYAHLVKINLPCRVDCSR